MENIDITNEIDEFLFIKHEGDPYVTDFIRKRQLKLHEHRIKFHQAYRRFPEKLNKSDLTSDKSMLVDAYLYVRYFVRIQSEVRSILAKE